MAILFVSSLNKSPNSCKTFIVFWDIDDDDDVVVTRFSISSFMVFGISMSSSLNYQVCLRSIKYHQKNKKKKKTYQWCLGICDTLTRQEDLHHLKHTV